MVQRSIGLWHVNLNSYSRGQRNFDEYGPELLAVFPVGYQLPDANAYSLGDMIGAYPTSVTSSRSLLISRRSTQKSLLLL
ncbi:hypothetical protein F1609_33515 [Massilia sp. CCM 8693]|uniref:Uncharacterized protein n=1 Tax=Massilia aquatica TaxID=2609000 RepID=A0ABX0MEB0_9BURK|nr:hypothetical protein [Massilia aquatica]NHZ45023.1 hypothetical protein [Massilia aquatica]